MSLDITPAEALLCSQSLEADPPTVGRGTLWLMAAACGASAANIFYNQPLLGDFAAYFRAPQQSVAMVATAAQVGYGVGLFFFVPLGDLLERRRIVLMLVWSCVLLLIATSLAPSLRALIALHALVGITSMGAQILIPLGIDLTPPKDRGRTVGTLMAGLLVGVLLARTVSGFVGDYLNWRAMYAIAACVMTVLGVLLHFGLPHRPPSLVMSYPKLMHSMIDLLITQPRLWVASAVSGLSFACFTAFWTTLSFLMNDYFHRGSSEAGMFGIVGIIGALAAPIAGKLSDRKGPTFTVTMALVATILSFVVMGWWVTIPGLVIGVLLMDLGVQSIQVAEQSEVMALVPEARSRINTLYMVARFIGAAGGSALGAAAWAYDAWRGVCVASVALLVVAMLIHLIGTSRLGLTRPVPV